MRTKMVGVIVTASLIVFSMCSRAVAVDWSDPDWGYRKIITVDNNGNSNALTNYPVIVQLGSSNFDFDLAKPNGEDWRFTSRLIFHCLRQIHIFK